VGYVVRAVECIGSADLAVIAAPVTRLAPLSTAAAATEAGLLTEPQQPATGIALRQLDRKPRRRHVTDVRSDPGALGLAGHARADGALTRAFVI